MSAPRAIDPRLRVVFLLAVAVGAFLVRAPLALAGGAALLAVGWLAAGLGARRLARQVLKLWGLATFVALSYGLTESDDGASRWVELAWGRSVNAAGLEEGAAMVLRVLAIVLASQLARVGDARAIVSGLGRLGAPERFARAMDAVLALMGSDERRGRGDGSGGGRGDGSGGGRGRGADGAPAEGFWAAVRRLARGDVEPIVRRWVRQVRRAEDAADPYAPGARDLSVVVGTALTMLGIKALKVLPSIPFAPGHKLVVLTPLYVLATQATAPRARRRGALRTGATLTGATMGSVAFLLGDGKYGVLEIVKHVVPGVLADLIVPAVLARPALARSALAWCAVGGLLGAGRFATIFAITALVQAPALAYAILVPGLLVHVGFGVASGWVTRPLVAAAERVLAEEAGDDAEVPPSSPASPAAEPPRPLEV
jgi:hypothetical protein